MESLHFLTMGDWMRRKITPLKNLKSKLLPLRSGPNLIRRHPSYRGDADLPNLVTPEVRQLDGGFFEKFGCMLHQQLEATRSTRRRDNAKAGDSELSGDEAEVTEGEGDSSSEEEQAPPNQAEVLADVSNNVEQLYSEVLYEMLHELGCDANECKQEQLFEFLREAFQFDETKHEELLSEARAKEAPDVLLNVEVVEAKELRPKDANGLSDPFCTLYLSNCPTQRYNTSVKPETLAPVWEEHFSLPVDNPQEETLTIEVWDFDQAETVREKLGKVPAVKGLRGVRKLVKEIAVTVSTGKHDNELIGTAIVPLKSIPTQGHKTWVDLEKRGKSKRQGEVRLKLALSAAKNSQVACQEHRQLVRILLRHEVVPTEVAPHVWSGEFSEMSRRVLNQHVAQSNLDAAHEALASWAEFCAAHQTHHPLSYQLFGRVLEKLVRPLQNGLFNDEEVKVFWDAAKKLLPSCLTCIRKLRKLMPTDKATLVQLEALLSVLAQLETLEPPSGFELFPASMFAWLTVKEGELNCDVRQSVMDAVKQGAKDWVDHVVTNTNEASAAATEDATEDEDKDERLSRLVRIVTLLQSDMLRAIEYHDKIYLEVLQFPYAKTVYAIYEKLVCDLVQPQVSETCKKLKPLKFNERPEDGIFENDHVTMGTSLFELYITLQRFCMLGRSLDSEADHQIRNFHEWFQRGVNQWLDIALYKALQRIKRAVDLGNLMPLDDTVKFSTSAVDTLAIFYQIKIFWKELNWPDVESSYSFMAKIIDDICRCSVFYADQMSLRVEGMGIIEDAFCKKFVVTEEWCTAINNIEYVRQSIQPFVMELGLNDLVNQLAEFRSPAEADHCRDVLQLVVDNAVETVGNKIAELIEILAVKMCPAMQRFLQEGAELLHRENLSLERLMSYLSSNLRMLHSHLSDENFNRTLSVIWERLANVLVCLVDASLDARRPPYYFSNLLKTLEVLEGFFSRDDQQQQQQHESDVPDLIAGGDCAELLEHTKARLKLHALETAQLVHEFHLSRLAEQQGLTTTPSQAQGCGLLTVRLMIAENTLHVEILNARNIKPGDPNGTCDPYVKVHLLPEERFAGAPKPKTRVHKKNLFPLFDEIFTIPLSEDQLAHKESLVHLVVKDYEMIRSNELVGEAFVKFSNIQHGERASSLEHLAQMHLPLTRPSHATEYEALKALEHRQGDSMAKDFLKKERAKMV